MHLRIYHSWINYLTNSLTILTPIWSIGCPRISKWRCNSRRCPRIRRRHLNTLIQILDSRLSNLRRNMKMKAMTSVFKLVIIMSFSSNWNISLMGLSLVNLMVVSTNHLRRVNRYAIRI